jgi:hypothetical protein
MGKIMRTKRLIGFTSAYLILIFIVAACGGAAPAVDAEPTPAEAENGLVTYVGDVDGDLFIAFDMIESEGGGGERAVRAYLCDGADISIWMTGLISGDEGTLVSGDTRIALASVNSVSGTVSLDGGAEVSFTTDRAVGEAGLYRAEVSIGDRDYIGGWIVLSNGQQRGAITLGEQVIENPTLNTSTGEVETSIGILSTVRCFINPFTGERICFTVSQ